MELNQAADLDLKIQLFGGFQACLGNHPLPGLTAPRTQRLLAYLLLNRHSPQPRQRVAFQLWLDSSAAQAQANLRKELSHVRRVLPQSEALLWVEAKTLQWRPTGPFWLDVASFEQGLQGADQSTDGDQRCAQLKQALAHYVAPLLPDADDEWVMVERERLHRRYQEALDHLIRDLEAQGDTGTALTYAQARLQTAPLNEVAYQTVMRLQGRLGDRASALQTYHQCMTTLQTELGVLPSPATRHLYEQLLREEPVPQAPMAKAFPDVATPSAAVALPLQRAMAPALPLVGRDQAWTTVQRWAERVAPADGESGPQTETVLLILGEPGIGKTRLLEELRAMAQPWQVLWGQGFAAEMRRPYGVWIDALRTATPTGGLDLPPDLGFLQPGQHAAPTISDPTRLLDAVTAVLAQWARQKPLLLVFDDGQWLDEASVALLHYAIRVLRPLPVGFALAARSGELAQNRALSEVMQALRREQRLQTLDLLPLDYEETAALVHQAQRLAPSPPSAATANQVFLDSGGNPLFALELVRLAGRSSGATRQSLEDLIGDRLQQLDDASRDLLPWAAALGRRFDLATLAHIADYPITHLLTVMEQLEQQGILRPSTGQDSGIGGEHKGHYDFAHDVLRQTVYHRISAPRRQLMHRQIAQRLQTQTDGSQASNIAYHAALGGDPALAATSALAAAEYSLRVFAYQEALALAQQGLHHSQTLLAAQRLDLQAQLWRVCIVAGLTPDLAPSVETQVQGLIQEAAALGHAEAEAKALETLTTLQFEQSNFESLHEYSLRLAEVNRFTSPTTAARMLAYSGSCLAEIGRDMERAEALLLKAQTLAERVGLACVDLHHGLGCVYRHHGRYEEARFQLQRAWRLAQAQQDHWRESLSLSYLALTELEAGDPAAALIPAQTMVEVSAQIPGEGSETAVGQALLALAQYQMQAIPSASAMAPGIAMESVAKSAVEEATEEAVEEAIVEAIVALDRVDAKRPLAYLLTGAAAVDRQQQRFELAVQRAQRALTLAQTINHPSDVVISWAELIQSLKAAGQTPQAHNQLTALRQVIPTQDLSLRAQMALDALSQEIPCPSSSSKP